MVFAIRDQNNVLESFLPVIEDDIERAAHGVADEGAASTYAIDGHVVEHRAEESIVEGEGTLDHRGTGVRDEGDAIPLQPFNRVENAQLRTFEPIGREVLGEHAP